MYECVGVHISSKYAYIYMCVCLCIHLQNPNSESMSNDALPFLEDTITHLVGREQSALSRHQKIPPSRIRATAMHNALAGFGQNKMEADGILQTQDTPADASRHALIQSSSDNMIEQANHMINVISTIEHEIPLTLDQRLILSDVVLRGQLVGSRDKFSKAVTPTSAWRSIKFLLHKCLLTPEEVARVLAEHPVLIGARTWEDAEKSPPSVLECLRLLDLQDKEISDIILKYPGILLVDIDADMLPTLAYLSDLGFTESGMASLTMQFPSIYRKNNVSVLQAGVAFWIGKGLSKTDVVSMMSQNPQIFEINRKVMQVKVDWLSEHTGLQPKDFAGTSEVFAENLGSYVAPRISFAIKKGLKIKKSGQKDDHGVIGLNSVLASDEIVYLSYLNAGREEFSLFVNSWYYDAFIPWLERKNNESMAFLNRAHEELVNDENEHSSHVNLITQREFAWEQQQEREREWYLAWQEWKKEQQSTISADRSARRVNKRMQADTRLNPNDAAILQNYNFKVHLNDGNQMCVKSPHCSREFGHTGVCNRKLSEDQNPQFLPSSIPDVNTMWDTVSGGPRSIYFLSREWQCDEKIDQALEQATQDAQAMKGVRPDADVDIDLLPKLSVERVQSCAVNLLLLLKASKYGILEPKVFYAWAARTGVSNTELTAAKALISRTNAAFVRPEPSWKYYAVPPRVWCLAGPQVFAPELLPIKETRGSKSVSVLAMIIYDCLRSVPNIPMSRSEIAEKCGGAGEFQSKKVRFAIAVLLEQGLVVQRRRKGSPSGPMELVLTDVSKYEP